MGFTTTGRRGRDQQRQRAYDAENAVRSSLTTMLGDIHETRAYVEKVTRSAWFLKHYGRRTIEVRDGRGRSHAAAQGSHAITLPRWARSDFVVLHEIAHCLTRSDPGHGAAWAATYLKLVRHYIGKEAHGALRAEFKRHRVRYTTRSTASAIAASRSGRALVLNQSPEARKRNLAKARVALIRKRLEKLERTCNPGDVPLAVERARLVAALEHLAACEDALTASLAPPAPTLAGEDVAFLIDSSEDALHSVRSMLERTLPDEGTRAALWRAEQALEEALGRIRPTSVEGAA